ncbi:hypothetical protein BDN72DRAFT_887183 [Pluteus cervinus]|uniref:Uncharacterized protein n=1 Tax=Pluteus cervinus TaxID=181527 RepID=A0ACD3B4K1_9AGAR|nr:hypothetical protein BDN72DRAFT_887183 [Pluteus cervinus]
MAYNREWDQGKDAWGEGAWGNEAKPNVRVRDDEHYGDGKRRKFNNGGYDGFQAHDDSGNVNFQQDYGQDDRQRGFNKKRQTPSEPSPHVIFLGLDPDFNEADLKSYLSAHGCSIETVTIIRERSSGTCKFTSPLAHALTYSAGFGFAQFTSTEHARAFVDPLFPYIQVPPPASHGASATALYYKALEQGAPHNGRRVKIDYSQSASPQERGRFNRGNMNDGTRDIGNTQAPVLLFRGLDPLSGPQAIYQAMLYSSGHGKQGAKGMRRIILIKDKVTMASFGFCFVEFVDNQSASAVLAATMSPQIHPSGFRISDKPVAASFAHPYSFQPVTDMLSRDEACLRSSLSLGGVEDTWVRYWDETSTVAVLEFQVEQPAQAVSTQKEKKEKKKGKVDVEALSTPTAPSELPISDKPVTLSFNKGIVKPSTATGPVKTVISLGFGDDALADESENLAEVAKVIDAYRPVPSKTLLPMIVSKKTVGNIHKWNQVQEELAQNTTAAPTQSLVSTPAPVASSSVAEPAPAEPELDFCDVSNLTCLLCSRQFKSSDQLKRHNKESDLHKARIQCSAEFKNLKDSNLRETARQKVAARKASQEQPKYRDRASERRVLFNQPEVPAPEKEGSKLVKARQAAGPPRPPTPPPPPLNPGQDENNVGNKLLKMMGWKEGTGLGTDGDGRIDPISTAVYAQGVGLGASKGKEVGKYADGYAGYVHMAQDAARERYGS